MPIAFLLPLSQTNPNRGGAILRGQEMLINLGNPNGHSREGDDHSCRQITLE